MSGWGCNRICTGLCPYLGQVLLCSTWSGSARTSAASSHASGTFLAAPPIAGTLFCDIVHGIMLHIVHYITSYIIDSMASNITSSNRGCNRM